MCIRDRIKAVVLLAPCARPPQGGRCGACRADGTKALPRHSVPIIIGNAVVQNPAHAAALRAKSTGELGNSSLTHRHALRPQTPAKKTTHRGAHGQQAQAKQIAWLHKKFAEQATPSAVPSAPQAYVSSPPCASISLPHHPSQTSILYAETPTLALTMSVCQSGTTNKGTWPGCVPHATPVARHLIVGLIPGPATVLAS